jgi:hypothetical protein
MAKNLLPEHLKSDLEEMIDQDVGEFYKNWDID